MTKFVWDMFICIANTRCVTCCQRKHRAARTKDVSWIANKPACLRKLTYHHCLPKNETQLLTRAVAHHHSVRTSSLVLVPSDRGRVCTRLPPCAICDVRCHGEIVGGTTLLHRLGLTSFGFTVCLDEQLYVFCLCAHRCRCFSLVLFPLLSIASAYHVCSTSLASTMSSSTEQDDLPP